MQRLGTASHVSKSGRLIIRAERPVPLMCKVYGPDMRPIGFVADVFGPVKSPYISVKPLKAVNPEEYVGKVLYFRLRSRGKGRRRKSYHGS
ncbi:MAG: H/ACA RNA-protein complex protein Gar1 [Thermoprotei archaeon]|nr:H/ACA RNA-protein complex protein Gar1 [Thermoprotei archaeon]